MYALGFDWKYADECPTLTTEVFQEKLIMTKRGSSDPPTSRPPLTIVSRPCARTFEARESALLNALLYVNDILSYYIGDLHFAEFIVQHSQTWCSTYVCMNFCVYLDICFRIDLVKIIMVCINLMNGNDLIVIYKLLLISFILILKHICIVYGAIIVAYNTNMKYYLK